MNNQQHRCVDRVLTGPALVHAMQNYAAVRQLIADAQPVVIQEGGDENNPLNINSDHPAEAGWREDSLPDNLGRLNPPASWHKETKVPNLVINKVVQLDGKGKPIRAFPFLPRFLSSNLAGKILEAYFHQDPKVRYEDLWARMPGCTPPLTAAIKNHRYNNRRIREVRAPYHVPCFTSRRSTITRTDVEIAATLSREMIRQATVWPITPNGIQDPSNAVRHLPLSTFLEPTVQFDKGSEETWKAVYMYSVLNMIAKVKKAPGDYRSLKRKHLPRSWNGRLSGSRAVPDSEAESDDDAKGDAPGGNIATQQEADTEKSSMGSPPKGGKRKRIQEEDSSEAENETTLVLNLRSDHRSDQGPRQIAYSPDDQRSGSVLGRELLQAVVPVPQRQGTTARQGRTLTHSNTADTEAAVGHNPPRGAQSLIQRRGTTTDWSCNLAGRLSYVSSPAVLPSERFEEAAIFAERQHRRYGQRRRSNVEYLTSSRAASASHRGSSSRIPPTNRQNYVSQPANRHRGLTGVPVLAYHDPNSSGPVVSDEQRVQLSRIEEAGRRPQDSSSTWAYGDYGDRRTRQFSRAQELPGLEPPSHGLRGLDDSEDVIYSSFDTRT